MLSASSSRNESTAAGNSRSNSPSKNFLESEDISSVPVEIVPIEAPFEVVHIIIEVHVVQVAVIRVDVVLVEI